MGEATGTLHPARLALSSTMPRDSASSQCRAPWWVSRGYVDLGWALGRSVVSAQSAPSLRSATMAYDSLRQRVVRFGGQWADPSAPPGFLNDTWEWDGATWIPMLGNPRPSATFAAMAYDAARGVCVLYTIVIAAASYHPETWEWNGAVWTMRFPSRSPSGSAQAMAYDWTAGQCVCVTGGYGTETWTYDGSNWSGPFPGPVVSMGTCCGLVFGLEWNPVRGRVFAVLDWSPLGGTSYLPRFVEWDGTAWTPVPLVPNSPVISFSQAGFDGSRGRVVDRVQRHPRRLRDLGVRRPPVSWDGTSQYGGGAPRTSASITGRRLRPAVPFSPRFPPAGGRCSASTGLRVCPSSSSPVPTRGSRRSVALALRRSGPRRLSAT